jgi:Mg2+ and Co2+ transporter CorA
MKKHFEGIWVLVFVFAFYFSNGQETRKFTGKLASFEGGHENIANIPVRLVNQGTGVTGTDGIFTIAISENISEVTLELANSDLDIIYPADGRTNVPKDEHAIVEFIVGDSPLDILTRAVAKSNNEIRNRLMNMGVKQDGIEETLKAFLEEIQRMSDIKIENLTNEIDLANKREQFYPELASSLNHFINEAKDLKDAFKFTARFAFDDPHALLLLTDAVESYNEVFEHLNKNHSAYEKQVLDYWQSEVKASEVRELFNYALGELHSANIFTLNLKVRDINEYFRGNVKGSKKMFRQRIINEIEKEQLQLERRLEELDNRAQVVLTKLAI